MRTLNYPELNLISGGIDQSYFIDQLAGEAAALGLFGSGFGVIVGVLFSQIPDVKFFLKSNSCCGEILPMALFGALVGATVGAACTMVGVLITNTQS